MELLIIVDCCRPPKQVISCGVGGCTNQKKYSCSKTGTPLCSLDCYKKNLLQNAAQIPIPATWWLTLIQPWGYHAVLCWRWHSRWTATDRNMTIVMVMEAGEICQSCIIQPYSQCHTQVKEQVLVWVIKLYCLLFMGYILNLLKRFNFRTMFVYSIHILSFWPLLSRYKSFILWCSLVLVQ